MDVCGSGGSDGGRDGGSLSRRSEGGNAGLSHVPVRRCTAVYDVRRVPHQPLPHPLAHPSTRPPPPLLRPPCGRLCLQMALAAANKEVKDFSRAQAAQMRVSGSVQDCSVEAMLFAIVSERKHGHPCFRSLWHYRHASLAYPT